jgi:hypothetical protein
VEEEEVAKEILIKKHAHTVERLGIMMTIAGGKMEMKENVHHVKIVVR